MGVKFRKAKEAGGAWNLFKTCCQIVIFWGVLLYWIPTHLVLWEAGTGTVRWDFAGQDPLAGVLFFVASLFGLWSGVTMALVGRGTPLPLDMARDLVVRGPYAFVRNPMAVAGLLQGAAVAMYWGSPLVLVYSIVGGLLWENLVRPVEEKDLLERFGASYQAYTAQVRCWLPSVKPYKPEG